MPIAMVVVAVMAVVLSAMFSVKARGVVVKALRGIRNVGVAYAPTSDQIRRAIRPVLWTIVVLMVLGFLSSLIFSGVILALGFRGNAIGSSLLIAILFPAWCMMYMLKPILRRLVRIPYVITSILLIFALPFFLLGVWSPEVKESADRYGGNAKHGIANWLDKDSVQSEKEMGIFARVTEAGVLYNVSKEPAGEELASGKIVRVMSLDENKKVTPDSEGLVQIMIANKYGDYVDSDRGWFPARKLDWEWEKKYSQEVRPTAPAPGTVVCVDEREGGCYKYYIF